MVVSIDSGTNGSNVSLYAHVSQYMRPGLTDCQMQLGLGLGLNRYPHWTHTDFERYPAV